MGLNTAVRVQVPVAEGVKLGVYDRVNVGVGVKVLVSVNMGVAVVVQVEVQVEVGDKVAVGL